jgi:hypothetical protein
MYINVINLNTRQKYKIVDILKYEYCHGQVKIKKKRWNNKEMQIKKFYWK